MFSSSIKLDSFWFLDETEETGVPHSRCTCTHKNTSPWKDKLTGRGQWKINVSGLTWHKCRFYSLKQLEILDFFLKLVLLYEYFYLNRPILHLFLKELRPLVWFHPAVVSPFFLFCGEDVYTAIFPWEAVVGVIAHGLCTLGAPEPLGCCG